VAPEPLIFLQCVVRIGEDIDNLRRARVHQNAPGE
jgi:hypothetical protein